MFTPLVIPGPPGTGKTRTLVRYVAAQLDGDVPASEIAYLTFSRAAADGAVARVWEATGLAINETPWFRTLHSACRAILGVHPSKLMTDARWREFGKLHSYKFTDADAPELDEDGGRMLPTRTSDDVLRFAYDWGRTCCYTVEETLARFRGPLIRPAVFATYVRRLEAFKEEHGLSDFTDLLEDAYARDVWPPIRVGFVDEAQDLSPLQIAIIERWFAACERSYVAGDDDQAIYIHNGADPAWFCALAERCPVERLTVSQRLPRVIHEFAQRLIRRNTHRVEKAFEPRADGGEILRLDRRAAVRQLDGTRSAFVLARNRMFLWPYAQALLDAAVPFRVEGKGGRSPLSDTWLVRAVKATASLRENSGAAVSGHDLLAVLDRVGKEAPYRTDETVAAVKAVIKSQQKVTRLTMTHELGLGGLLEDIDAHGPVAPLKRLQPWKRDYLTRLLARYRCLPEPKITLTSIHGSKGLEADLVVLLSSMTPSTNRAYQSGGVRGREAETRVFYVGITRAKETLVIVPATSRRHFDFPSIAKKSTPVETAKPISPGLLFDNTENVYD